MAAFGGMRVDFSSVKGATLKDVFGTRPLKPSDMNKKLWAFIKSKELQSSTKSKEGTKEKR